MRSSSFAVETGGVKYLGPETCALCHKAIAATQQQTAMANTWRDSDLIRLPVSFKATVADDLAYEISRSSTAFTYSVDLGNHQKLTLPVAISMGGARHGIGFLSPIQDVGGIPLARRTLLQARYAWSPEQHKLLMAPGCIAAKPQSLESALGLVLSPTFELRCVSCHGKPETSGSGYTGGVHCEACHGPGERHLIAVSKGNPAQGIINPGRLSNEQSIEVCATCHVGLEKFSDPSPSDLLVANQVRAIRSSECFLQSKGAFNCTTCHDPHNDQPADDRRAVKACLSCHSTGVQMHAAICPVDKEKGCSGCHMPAVNMGPLHLVDHLIRVHPEQAVPAANKAIAGMHSTVKPVSEYLRMIATPTKESALIVQQRLIGGESFYMVARELSADPSASIGGYLGRKLVAELPAEVQEDIERLDYGADTQPLHAGGKWVTYQRLQRNFKWDSEQLQSKAESLAASGDAVAGIQEAQAALMIYPHFLRALSFIGSTFTRNGNASKGAEVLAVAARLYPQDATVEYLLGVSFNLSGKQAAAAAAFKQVLVLEPDFLAAYVDLGMLSYNSNDWDAAIRVFKAGLLINPLSAELNYDLGIALQRSGDTLGGNQAVALARALDAGLVEKKR